MHITDDRKFLLLMIFQKMTMEMFLYFVDEMLCDNLPQACVELLSVLVEHHRVCVPVQLLKAQPTVVLPLDLLDGIL